MPHLTRISDEWSRRTLRDLLLRIAAAIEADARDIAQRIRDSA